MGLGHQVRSNALQDCVERIWFYEGETGTGFERLGATVHAQLLINLNRPELSLHHGTGQVERAGGVAVQGLLTRPVLINREHKARICGVQFAVCGWSRFVGESASASVDHLTDASSVFDYANALREFLAGEGCEGSKQEVIESFLLARLRPEPSLWGEGQKAATMLTSGSTVGEVRRGLGLSQRDLHRCFDGLIGVRPKLFARIARVQMARTHAAGRLSWSDHAAGSGFADQAHMVREYSRFTGATPATHDPPAGEPHHGVPTDKDRLV